MSKRHSHSVDDTPSDADSINMIPWKRRPSWQEYLQRTPSLAQHLSRPREPRRQGRSQGIAGWLQRLLDGLGRYESGAALRLISGCCQPPLGESPRCLAPSRTLWQPSPVAGRSMAATARCLLPYLLTAQHALPQTPADGAVRVSLAIHCTALHL